MTWASSVDELLRLRKKEGITAVASYREDARRQLGGRWIGRYAQSVILTRPAWMDVHFDVRLSAEGEEMVGKGMDGIGPFEMDGWLSADATVRLTKRYIGAHQVAYEGVLEERSIRGVWTISASNYGLFAFHHIDDLDRGCLPKRGILDRLWSVFFHTEGPLDARRHQELVDQFRVSRR
jgi:hypothetical protein